MLQAQALKLQEALAEAAAALSDDQLRARYAKSLAET
jgi:hypothetical protein